MNKKTLKSQVGRFLRRTGLYNPFQDTLRFFLHVYGFATNRHQRVWGRYKSENTVRKLHLGCGSNYLKGWLNTDLYPDTKRIPLNATTRFPFDDSSFDFVFSEHMIEHIPYKGGFTMLSESFRVLKPGGKIRIVTPDLPFLIGLYNDRDNPLNKKYTDWNNELFIQDKAIHDPVSVINNFFRDWGHQYIYDFDVMKKTFEKIGFVNISRESINKSSVAELSGLEHDTRMPENFLELESMVIEGQKPV